MADETTPSLAVPLTEIELGEIMHVCSIHLRPAGMDKLRRLAFERDELRDRLADAVAAKDAAESRLASVYEECAVEAEDYGDPFEQYENMAWADQAVIATKEIAARIRRLAARPPASNSGEGGEG